jgi:hypothetical protein
VTQAAVTTNPELYTIDFSAGHQRYVLDGKRVPGVTTYIGIMAKPFLIPWANKMGLDGIDTTKYVDRQADIGTVTHARIHCDLTGKTLDERNLSPDVISKSANGYLRFLDWWQRERFVVIASELQMVSRRFRCGGTLDILAQRPDGKRALIDIKTGKGIYTEAKIQSSVYAEMWEELERDRIRANPELMKALGDEGFLNATRIDYVWVVRTGKEDEDDLEVVEVMNRKPYVEVFERIAELYPLWSKLR